MSQQGPSKRTKTIKKRTYAKPVVLSSLVQQKRSFLTTQETIHAMRLEKRNLLKLIEKEQPIAKQQVAPQAEANEQCVDEQSVEEQQTLEEQPTVEEHVQMDYTSTISTNEQSEEQAADPSTQKKRGTTQMQSVHARHEREI